MKNEKTRIMCESGIMIALATVLSLIKVWQSPYGGAVTLLSMAPITVLSLRRGVKVGLISGFVYSLVQLMFGLSNVAWVPSAGGIVLCVLFDYIIPFTLLGLGGMLRRMRFTKNGTVDLIIAAALGALTVCLIRFACHVVSGVVIWYALDIGWYGDDPEHIVNLYGPWLFSVIYNGTFMLPETVETVVGVPLLCKATEKIK